MIPKFEEVLVDIDEHVATITLNRPQSLNAWTGRMQVEVEKAMRIVDEADEVRVVVLTGAGRGFCSGADLKPGSTAIPNLDKTFEVQNEPGTDDTGENFARTYSYFPSIRKPIIAAINGPCAGLGLVLSLFCDMRFASEAASFTTAFSKRGLVAEHGISWMLPRLIGMAHAFDLLYSSRKFSAHEAFEMGLINRMWPEDRFRMEVHGYARDLSTQVSPRSLREMKRELWEAQFQSLYQAIDSANADMRKSLLSEDYREGVAHFLEKRAPNFTGR